MASSSGPLLPEEQLLCSVCGDVFTDPVTLPCGHNFCHSCILGLWSSSSSSSSSTCSCPHCQRAFPSHPELSINIAFREIAERFKATRLNDASAGPAALASKPQLQSAVAAATSAATPAAEDEIPCDVCTGPRLRAAKACLECLTSYCETHLEPHLRVAGLRRHRLIEPVEHLEERACSRHGRPLELYCRWDQMAVCRFCAETDHLDHVMVTLEVESLEKKVGCTCLCVSLSACVYVNKMIETVTVCVDRTVPLGVMSGGGGDYII